MEPALILVADLQSISGNLHTISANHWSSSICGVRSLMASALIPCRMVSVLCMLFIPSSCGAATTKREKGFVASGEPGGATLPIQFSWFGVTVTCSFPHQILYQEWRVLRSGRGTRRIIAEQGFDGDYLPSTGPYSEAPLDPRLHHRSHRL